MPLTGQQLVEHSVEAWKRQEADALLKKYERLADHYDGNMQGESYFPRYFMETKERYDRRPKQALPVVSSSVDILAGAMIGEGVAVTIGESDSEENKVYQEIQEHNDLDGDNALSMATMAGAYGWGAERILIDDGMVEFERVSPIYFMPFYDAGAIGRTVKRVSGISFATFWDPDTMSAVPRNTSIAASGKDVRVEVITADEWWVYLNGEPQPTQPGDDSVRWMPTDDGRNPYGVIPVSLLWNVHHINQFEGRADADPAYKVAEEISRVYSQMLYNIQMAFPTLTIPRATGGQQTGPLAMGLGLGLEYSLDGQPPSWIAPPFDVSKFMEPLKAMLTLFFSLIHTPASAHGLGSIFGEQTHESGIARHYSLNSMSRHIHRKRTHFERFVQMRWRNLCAVLNQPQPYGLGKNMDPEAPVQVEWPRSVVPVSDEEVLDTVIKKLKARLMSQVEAMLFLRGLDDTEDNRKKVQQVLDEIGEAYTRTAAKSPLERLLAGEGQAQSTAEEGE